MRKLGLLLLAYGVLGAQDLPPAAGAPVVPAAPVVLENTGKPMLAPFRCTEEDIRSAGLGCSEQDPCPVYLELAAVESTGRVRKPLTVVPSLLRTLISSTDASFTTDISESF